MPTYVALLRGINVGGNKKVPMSELKSTMEQARYDNVRTLLNSGNVVFTSRGNVTAADVASVLKKHFGFDVPVILRTEKDIVALIKSDPFAKEKVTKDTRLYATFLSGKTTPSIKIPYTSPDGEFRILSAGKTEVISVLTLTAKTGTTDGMLVLEKEFGKNITTRNWNTVQKIAAMF